ncbi:hypothetical protein BegalDRAFT_1049 [Beggiatoa alba B18LD]|uniref:Uncharacterized protein n=1 Tax=Beggiatoa alba B18LD TaxID=395493 RepID=I3CEA9_9GAMM|nr:hypothetical protein [Beggiatoa alba]EIJ41952.1 hypothetical protein BegalDRAFT_1049 [Beggiatoa alba B18LD]
MSNSLSTELKENPRLRLGLWMILGILLAYGVLRLDDYRRKVEADYAEAEKRLAQLHQITQQNFWLTRREQIQTALLDTESRLWIANTKGLAQANIQAWFNNQMKGIGIKEAKIRVDNAIDSTTAINLWQVTTQVDAPFIASNTHKLLLAIASNPQWLIVERFDIRQGQPLRFTLIVTAYFQPPANS